jgi:uncharacterized GH25 family protein
MKKIAVILLILVLCSNSSFAHVIAVRDPDKYINTEQLKP